MRFAPDDCVDFWFVSTIQSFNHSVILFISPSILQFLCGPLCLLRDLCVTSTPFRPKEDWYISGPDGHRDTADGLYSIRLFLP